MKRGRSMSDIGNDETDDGDSASNHGYLASTCPGGRNAKKSRDQAWTIDDTINMVAFQSQSQSVSPSSPDPSHPVSFPSNLTQSIIISQQSERIRLLERTVQELSMQLKVVTDFLGMSPLSAVSAKQADPVPVEAGRLVGPDRTADTETDIETDIVPTQRPQKQTRKPAANPVQKSLRDVVLDAIHRDVIIRQRRAKTFVIYGLETLSITSDRDSVRQLLRKEFDFDPVIVYCKRLGQPMDGRVQPLLVAMDSAQDVAWLTANAKQLRKSSDVNTRRHVYINAYRTREEARGDYEQRCRRRMAAAAGDRDADTDQGDGQANQSMPDAVRVVVSSRFDRRRDSHSDEPRRVSLQRDDGRSSRDQASPATHAATSRRSADIAGPSGASGAIGGDQTVADLTQNADTGRQH